MPDINHILNTFESVQLQELNLAALQNRLESKYLFPESALAAVLQELRWYYRALDIGGKREFDYLTWYFDTLDFRLYRDHHNGYTHRMKIRQRRYEQSGITYFEVKRKENELRTDKIRMRIPALQPFLSQDLLRMIPGNRVADVQLACKLSNRFCRITLCNKSGTERVTLDRHINMENENRQWGPGPVILLEIKQQRPAPQSAALMLMKKLHIFETGFSKYAVAAAMMYPELKRNNLKPVFLKLQQYTHY